MCEAHCINQLSLFLATHTNVPTPSSKILDPPLLINTNYDLMSLEMLWIIMKITAGVQALNGFPGGGSSQKFLVLCARSPDDPHI